MAGKKILIVEDEVVQLTALARRLKSAGFEVVAARDGLTAISTARKEQPDLIVLDLGIPAGDGFVVLQRLSMLINTGTIPVIVLSSRTPIGNRDAALKAGAIAYIHKPVDVPVLLKVINDALGLSPSEAPPEPPPNRDSPNVVLGSTRASWPFFHFCRRALEIFSRTKTCDRHRGVAILKTIFVIERETRHNRLTCIAS